MITLAKRMQALPGNFFAGLEKRIVELAQSGYDVIRLDVGSPDLPPPGPILDQLVDSIHCPDRHGYQPPGGPLRLLQAWAHLYRNVFQVELDPETEILPLIGSKEGIFHLTQAYVEPGDIVLTPDPGYMTYLRAAIFAGGEPYSLFLRPENGYLPDLEAIPPEIASRAKLLWLNYPNNPTTAVANLDFYAQAVDIALRNNILICSDAAYSQVTFDGYQAPSLLEIPGAKQVAVEFNSLSKSHNLAGWRAGAMVGHAQAVQALFRLKTNQDSGHFLPILEAVAAGMTGDQAWISERNEIYRQRRDLVVAALREMDLEVSTPLATIYAWCRLPPGWSCVEFVTALLENAYVSLTPGTVFGQQGEGYVRLALTAPFERIAEALERMKTAIPILRRSE